MGMRSCLVEDETVIWMSDDFHSLFGTCSGFSKACEGGLCFHTSSEELTDIQTPLCAWQTYMFGTGRGGWQQQHSNAISEVFLFSCFLTVIKDGHWGVSAGILSLIAWIRPVLAEVALTATGHELWNKIHIGSAAICAWWPAFKSKPGRQVGAQHDTKCCFSLSLPVDEPSNRLRVLALKLPATPPPCARADEWTRWACWAWVATFSCFVCFKDLDWSARPCWFCCFSEAAPAWMLLGCSETGWSLWESCLLWVLGWCRTNSTEVSGWDWGFGKACGVGTEVVNAEISVNSWLGPALPALFTS